MSLLIACCAAQSSVPVVSGYPLNDDGTVAALFGVGWLETDAPDYTSADYTYTGAATGGTVTATPTQANIFASQAVTVTAADILSLEAEIVGITADNFSYIGIGAVMSSGGTPGAALQSSIADNDGTNPVWSGTGIVERARVGATDGFRVGIDINGTTGEVRIKSSDGIEISSATFTPPMNFSAYLFADDKPAVSSVGTASIRLIVPAADYTLPCPVGAKNLTGQTI